MFRPGFVHAYCFCVSFQTFLPFHQFFSRAMHDPLRYIDLALLVRIPSGTMFHDSRLIPTSNHLQHGCPLVYVDCRRTCLAELCQLEPLRGGRPLQVDSSSYGVASSYKNATTDRTQDGSRFKEATPAALRELP